MKKFAKLTAHSVPPALGGLVLGAILVGLGFAGHSLLSPEASFSRFTAAWSLGLLVAIFAVGYGLLPVLIFGAPAYAILVHHGRANYLTVALLGCIPGIFLLAFRPDYGGLFLLFGVPVALIAHFLARRSSPLQRAGR